MTSITATPEKPATVPDYTAIKQRQQATWASGDYTIVGTTLQIVGETLAEAVDVRSGERVLDVAAGNGNATLAAARRFADVTSTDYVQALLDKGRGRARRRRPGRAFRSRRRRGACPTRRRSFDVALSTFGVMFAPDHANAARELIRVVRPGGRIGMANWTPEEIYRPPVQDHRLARGTAGRRALAGALGHRGAPGRAVRPTRQQTSRCGARCFSFRYRSAAHLVQVFRDFYGPTHKAFGALDAGGGAAALERDILALLNELDVGKGRGLVVPSEMLKP